MSNQKRYKPEPASAPGDFYNVQNECVSCGVPHSVAPDLVGWIEDPKNAYAGCYWIKQPETPAELERAFLIFDGQEVGCHRYAGTDPLIQIRIGDDNCDNPVSGLESAPPHKVRQPLFASWGTPSRLSDFATPTILERLKQWFMRNA